MRTLIDGVEPGGWHQVVWDRRDSRGTNVAPGVYLARLATPGRTATRKVVLLP